MRLSTFVPLSLSMLAMSAFAGTMYVSKTGSDENSGVDWDNAKASVQAAVTAAAPNDTIIFADGKYDVGYHVVIDKALIIKGENSAWDTTISGNNNQRRVFWIAAGGDVTFEDITIADGYASDENHYGGGVRLSGEDGKMAHALFNRCILTRNICRDRGAAVWAGSYSLAELENCLVVGNTSWNYAVLCTEGTEARMELRNCTVTRNNESSNNGIVCNHGSGITALNSIIIDNHGNQGEKNLTDWGGFTFSNCCVNPIPANGTFIDCITSAPGFINHGTGIGTAYQWDGDLRLGPASPCIDAAAPEYAAATDFAGATRPKDGDGDDISIPDIGAYEADGPNEGSLRCFASADIAGGIAPFSVTFSAALAGADTFGTTYYWVFGDGDSQSTDQATISHAYATAGTFTAYVCVTNAANENARSSDISISAAPAVLYVSPDGGNIAPYDTWETAATSIQTAIDTSFGNASTSSVVRVTNGVYNLSSMLMIGHRLVLESVNGYTNTTVVGGNGQRCLYIYGEDVVVSGFTFTNGVATGGTGGNFGGNVEFYAARGTVRNCRITGGYTTDRGGGVSVFADDCVLENCLIDNNRTTNYGGAVSRESGSLTIRNCTIIGNYAPNSPGGIFGALTLVNCIAYDNRSNSANQDNYNLGHGQSLTYCCTTPSATGTGNIDLNPLFADAANGDYHLSPGSPCIDAGTDAGAPADDLDGAMRPTDGDGDDTEEYDIGCYEAADAKSGPFQAGFAQTPASGLAPLEVEFSVVSFAGSNTNGVSVAWDFGDGTTTEFSSILVVTNIYTSAGRYSCKAIARNSANETFELTLPEITVSPSDIFVSPTGNAVFPYDSIENAATDLATALETAYGDANGMTAIHVLPGNYVMPSTLTFSKPAHIVGEGAPGAVVFSPASDHYRGFYIPSAANGTIIEGVTIAGFNHWITGKSQGYGGAVQIDACTATLQRCIIHHNYADDRGGAIGIANWGTAILKDCLLYGNESTNAGGAIGIEAGHARLENCTITGNRADPTNWMNGRGPAAIILSGPNGSDFFASNSIIFGNGDGILDDIHYDDGDTSRRFNHMKFTNCVAHVSADFDNVNCLDEAPRFVEEPTGVGIALTGGDFHLAPTSHCRNAGDNGLVTISIDLDGNYRVVGSAVEIGCYEIQPNGMLLMLK